MQPVTLPAAIVLGALLVAITIVDFRRMIIPDGLNLALAAAGAGICLVASPDLLPIRSAGAIAAVAAFWLVRRLHTGATGRIGLGLGDVKMAGASALWLSPALLPTLLLFASSAALVYALGRSAIGGAVAADTRMPFGPFLAFGLAVTWSLQQWLI